MGNILWKDFGGHSKVLISIKLLAIYELQKVLGSLMRMILCSYLNSTHL